MASTDTSPPAALYARVSTHDKGQDPELQLAELRAYAERRQWQVVGEFVDYASGADKDRPALAELMSLARSRKVSVVAVWRFDRFARSTSHLLEALGEFHERDIDFVSLREQIDTTTTTGKLMFTIMAAVAEFERGLIRERVIAGVAKAKAAGKHCGRPRKQVDISEAQRLLGEGVSMRAVAKKLNLSRRLLQRRLAELDGGGA